jgi:hypothetical protein
MSKSKRSQSFATLLLTILAGVVCIGLIVALCVQSGDGYYLKAAAGKPDASVQELAALIPPTHEYSRGTSLKLQDVSTSDPTVRLQAKELAKVWIHTFYTRMNNYTHEFCFVLVDKEKYSISAVTLAIRAFQANGYKVKVSDSGFFYIVEIAE